MADRDTDNDIKKALECCITNKCDECTIYKECHNENGKGRVQVVLDLINRLEKENNDLFLELEGVMWSVDKWLDGDELKQDKVNRAITMREKTLQITERQQAEIERLEKARQRQAQFLGEERGQKYELLNKIGTAKSEAIKEFAEKVETALDERVSEKIRERNPHWYIAKRIVRETAIEMTEGNQ